MLGRCYPVSFPTAFPYLSEIDFCKSCGDEEVKRVGIDVYTVRYLQKSEQTDLFSTQKYLISVCV